MRMRTDLEMRRGRGSRQKNHVSIRYFISMEGRVRILLRVGSACIEYADINYAD